MTGRNACPTGRAAFLTPLSGGSGLAGFMTETTPGARNPGGRFVSWPDGTRCYSESELTTSLPWVVLTAIQVLMLIEFLKNRTLPSHIVAFTPPGWKLRAPR
jgi:hypothetical protein